MLDLVSQGGMVVTGQTSNGGVSVSLPGFTLRLEKRSFEATHQGLGMGRLELQTSNGSISVHSRQEAVQ